MNDPIVYDKAKYHFDSVEQEKLDIRQAYVHTAFFFQWILEHELYSDEFREESDEMLTEFKQGSVDALEIYENWDGCLIDDMLNEEGNQFASAYFDFNNGKYIDDYAKVLAQDVPSMFHVTFNSENYAKIKPFIDKAYNSWKNSIKR